METYQIEFDGVLLDIVTDNKSIISIKTESDIRGLLRIMDFKKIKLLVATHSTEDLTPEYND